MKTTHRGLIDFINAASQYLALNKDETKLSYALNRVIKRAAKIHNKYLERREDLQIENCLVDEKGKIQRNPQGGYEFTKEGIKKFNEECRTALDSEVEIEPYIASALPEKLSLLDRDAFLGFVIEGQREE